MTSPIQKLRLEMKKNRIDAYLVPTSDFHNSEYVAPHFACREFLSGFTGSAGTLLVLSDFSGLWTDGRYFLQAEQELSGSGITLMKQGEAPTIVDFLATHLQAGQCLAFDGRCITAHAAAQFKQLACSIKCDLDLVGKIWTHRPPRSAAPAYELPLAFAGISRADKCKDLRSLLEQDDVLLLSALDEIAWLLNIRGNDIECNPVVLSYLALTSEHIFLFANPAVFSKELKARLAEDGVTICDYDAVYDYLRGLSEKRVLFDAKQINARMYDSITTARFDTVSPILLKKSIKNETECKNMKLAHLWDGLAVTRFLYWLDQNVGKLEITERTAAAQLETFRREQADYLGASFPPIIAYAAHGAIVHYTPTAATDAVLKPDHFLLMDTGGHYLQGTTDCTRTVALGTPTAEEKKQYTAVLRGLLNLADAQFLYGTTGVPLDYVARAPLLALGLNYAHSTGHGVGYLLNVHEGPNCFRASTIGATVLEAGMITSDEPGVYLPGQYGIRLENLILCVSRIQNEYGTFMGFEHLTCVPFDLNSVDFSALNAHELFLLRAYQEFVFETLAPFLDDAELAWLSRCRPLKC